MLTFEKIRALPKVELHEHLDGSLRIGTLLDLARSQNIQLPETDPAALKALLVPRQASLEHYLKAFETTVSVLQTPQALERAAFETVEDWAQDGLIYGEVRFAPELHTRQGLGLEEIVEAVLAGLERGQKLYRVATGLILCAMRHSRTALTIARLVNAYIGRGVVGFDIAGPEASFPPRLHRDAFDFLAENHLPATCHAGEAADVSYIREALVVGRVLRIGHGTKLFQDWDSQEAPPTGSLSRWILDRQIPLEICLTSNIQTSAAKDWESHPFLRYWRYGFAVALCTDNRLMSDTSLSRELQLATTHYGLTEDDLRKLQFRTLRSAFCSYETKKKLTTRYFPEFDEFL